MLAHESAREDEFDIIIVGAGFAGLYMLYRARELGLRARVFEAGDGVGGTWYWNRYPGARCDIESVNYSYSFSEALEQEWEWSHRYGSQPEILNYLNYVADRFALRRDIQLNTRVTSASFDDDERRWIVLTDDGFEVGAQFCVMATGCLSEARTPNITGLADFTGSTFHTGRWPHEGVDFTGKRVGIIGTGSSGIQTVPHLADQAAKLVVFQRTPNFSIPAHNHQLDVNYLHEVKANYRERRREARKALTGVAYLVDEISTQTAMSLSAEQRRGQVEARWNYGGMTMLMAFADVLLDKEANDQVADFLREKIQEKVHDPETARRLMPIDHPFGTKRPCVDSHYFETFNRDHVSLVDLRETPIERITAKGISTSRSEYELDSLVFATGFDAFTGALSRMDIRGRENQELREKWRDGPRTYLGLTVADFPNLFLITGPGSPSVLANTVLAVEQHVEWITEALRYLGKNDSALMEPTQEAEDQWVRHVDELAHRTLYPQANSWYSGSNIEGKPRRFMPYVAGLASYIAECERVVSRGYEGFRVTS